MIPNWFVQNPAWSDFLLKVVAGVGAMIAYIVGLRQYSKSQNWQKATFLTSLITEFETNPKIVAVKTMLDWDEGTVQVPPSITFSFTNAVFCSALRSPVDGDPVTFPFPQDAIRDVLDAFFDFFEKVESHWAIGLLEFGDLRYFYYWFESLRSMDKWKDVQCKKALDDYLTTYRFLGVKRLLDEYANLVGGPPTGFPIESRR